MSIPNSTSTSDARLQSFRRALNEKLNPIHLELFDDSQLHAGHAGAQGGAGHYRIFITSEIFRGRSRLNRHRLVYDALDRWFPSEIHALIIHANTPEEK